MKNFDALLNHIEGQRKPRVAVAQAADEHVLEAVSLATEQGYVSPILVGKKEDIIPLVRGTVLETAPVIDAASDQEAADKAVEACRLGEADLLMKGQLNTSIYMKAILNKERGIRNKPLISVAAVYELPFYHKLLIVTDSGINPAPDGEGKAKILENALTLTKALGITTPKVGVLSANETVSPKIQSTMDAAYLVEEAEKGRFGNAIVEGPIAFDVLMDPQAAAFKHIDSRISGDADIVLVPTLDAGNALGKSWILFNDARWAGIVLGAKVPVLLSSRSDSAELKALSLAVAACLHMAQEG